MSENTATLVLEHLAPMRAAVDRVEQRLGDDRPPRIEKRLELADA